MYGIFYLKKNNITNVILLFELKYESNEECVEIKIADWNQIKSFNESVKKMMIENIERHFSKPYHVYYRTIPNDSLLRLTMKELNLKTEDLNNPLVQVSNLDLNIESLLNLKV